MSKLKQQRKKLNLTQEELAERSGISVRSIQRIEAGSKLKGYTLKALSKAMDIDEDTLLEKSLIQKEPNYGLINFINISSILFVVFPPFNIIAPAIIMYAKKELNELTRQIITIQFFWTIFFIIFFLVGITMKKWLLLSNNVNLFLLLFPIIVNILIILRNATEIDRQGKLHIKLNFTIF